MFRTFGWQELLLILAIVLILFGATRLPQLGSAIGKTIRGFRRSMEGEEPEEDADEPAPRGRG